MVNEKTKAEWEAEKKKQEDLITQYTEEKKTQWDIIVSQSALHGEKLRESEEAEQNYKDMKTLVDDIVNDGTLDGILKKIPKANDEYIKRLANDETSAVFETDARHDGYKFFRWLNGLNNICFKMAEIFRDINVDELFKVIDDTGNTQFAHLQGTGTNKTKRDKLKEIFEIYKDNNEMFKYVENFTENGKRFVYWSKTIGDIKGKEDWEVIDDADNKPDKVVKYADIFYVMRELFPKSGLDDNILLNDAHCLKDSSGGNLLSKEYTIRYTASNDSDGNKFEDKQKLFTVNGLVWGKGGGSHNEGLAKLFWDIFGRYVGIDGACEIVLNNDNSKIDHGITGIDYRLRIESEWKVEQYKSVLNAIWRKKYVDAVKTFLQGKNKVFTDGLKKAAFEVAKAYTKLSSTTESEVRKIKKEKADISSYYLMDIDDKQGEKTALQRYNENVKKNPSRYAGKGTTLVLTKLDTKSYYQKFVSEAKANADLKKGLAETIGAPGKEASSAYSVVEAKLLEAKSKLKLAENALKRFEGLDLKGLKEEFMKIYGEGTKNGTVLGQWTPEQLLDMEDILSLIKKEEEGGKLDDTYNGYEKDLIINVKSKVISYNDLVNPLLNAFQKGKTFQEMVESMGFHKNNPDLIMGRMKVFKDAFDDIKRFRKFGPAETFLYEQVEYYVNNDGKYKEGKKIPAPSTALDKPNLGKILGITVEDSLLSKIKTIDGSELSLEKVKKLFALVGADHESKNDNDFKLFLAHLREKEGITETDDGKAWEKFLKDKKGEDIVNIIIKHKLENTTWRSEQETEMKSETTNLDPDKYTNFDEAGLKKYLFEKFTGKVHELKQTKEPEKKDDDKKSTEPKKWYEAYFYMVAWLPLSLAAIGGLVYYFWEDIKGWFGTSEGSTGEGEESE